MSPLTIPVQRTLSRDRTADGRLTISGGPGYWLYDKQIALPREFSEQHADLAGTRVRITVAFDKDLETDPPIEIKPVYSPGDTPDTPAHSDYVILLVSSVDFPDIRTCVYWDFKESPTNTDLAQDCEYAILLLED